MKGDSTPGKKEVYPKGSNNKKKKKPQGGRKKKPAYTGRVELYSVPSAAGFANIDDQIDASVVYSKTATGAFEIKLKDIKNRNQDPYSYDLFFLEPGYGTTKSTDTLCQLLGGEVTFTNPSPVELTLRIQRPMAFRDDLSALAMWEPLHGKLVHTLSPESSIRLKLSVHNTDHMAMREDVIHGHRGAHLMSLSIFKEPYARSGALFTSSVEMTQIALISEFVVRYKGADGAIGQQELFCVVPYASSNRLNYTTVGPMPPLRVCDIVVGNGTAVRAVSSTATNPKNKQCLAVRFASAGMEPVSACSLDENTIYRTDCVFVLQEGGTKFICRYLKFQNEEWIVGDVNQQAPSIFVPGKVLNDFLTPNMNIEDWLYPVPKLPAVKTSAFSLPRKNKSLGIQSRRAGHRHYSELKDLEVESLASTLIEALVVVYEVSKVAIQLLGVVGVLENPDLKVGRKELGTA